MLVHYYDVRAVWYSNAEEVKIRRGENRGKTITYTNVVRGMKMLGRYSGKAMAMRLDIDNMLDQQADHVAILVQQGKAGPIVAAYEMSLIRTTSGVDAH